MGAGTGGNGLHRGRDLLMLVIRGVGDRQAGCNGVSVHNDSEHGDPTTKVRTATPTPIFMDGLILFT